MEINETNIAFLALIVSILALVLSCRTSSLSTRLTMGQAEIQTRDQINSVCRDLEWITDKLKPKDCYKNIKAAVVERYLNTYDDACQRYLDGKLDRKRFKRSYRREIENLVRSDELADKYKIGTAYEATLAVYNEFSNPRKSFLGRIFGGY